MTSAVKSLTTAQSSWKLTRCSGVAVCAASQSSSAAQTAAPIRPALRPRTVSSSVVMRSVRPAAAVEANAPKVLRAISAPCSFFSLGSRSDRRMRSEKTG